MDEYLNNLFIILLVIRPIDQDTQNSIYDHKPWGFHAGLCLTPDTVVWIRCHHFGQLDATYITGRTNEECILNYDWTDFSHQ